jgi:hypothetical protein
MAVVNKPRNNLNEHLTWFNSQKPHIPPRAQGPQHQQTQVVNAINLPVAVPNNSPVLQLRPPVQNSTTTSQRDLSVVPTPANIRNPTVMPKPSEARYRPPSVEVLSLETTSTLTTAASASVVGGARGLSQQGTYQFNFILLISAGIYPPRPTTASKLPFNNGEPIETIDLVSDEEVDTTAKKESSYSHQARQSHDLPQSITIRKRPKNGDSQEETSSRSPPKRFKSPSRNHLSVSVIHGISHEVKESSPFEPQILANDASFTQIPDSGGEEEDDLLEADLNLNSDDLSWDAQRDVSKDHTLLSDPLPTVDMEDHDDVVVPESPIKVGRGRGDNQDERGQDRLSPLPLDRGKNVSLPSVDYRPTTRDASVGSSTEIIPTVSCFSPF